MSDPFVYPGSDLDRPRNLKAVLGTFWSRIYAAQDQVESYATAAGQQLAQTHLEMLETIACVSRAKIPVFHRQNWYFLALKQSERNDAQTSLAHYGDDIAYGDPAAYGVPTTRSDHAFPLPEKLQHAPLIMNRLTEPSVVLSNNIDFKLDTRRGALVFQKNPFDNPLIPQRPVYENGEIVDYEVGLWVFRGEFDWNFAYEHFGYQLGLKMQSSQGYKDLLNALFDALVRGANDAALEQALSAMTGVPLVQEQEETVEVVANNCDVLTIVTDKHAYRFNGLATALVAVGDVVHAGDPLVDALQIYEFNRGEVPTGLSGLVMGRGYLANCYYGELVFENKTLPLTVNETHASGYTYISFPLGGFPADVTKFFDEMHARGIVDAEQPPDDCDPSRRRGTLAQLLDTRTNRTGQPKANHLPATINPLEFLIANVLRDNAFLVRIKASAMGRTRLGLYNVRHLRKLLPPHAAMIILIELSPSQETVSSANICEHVAQFTAANRLLDTVPTHLVRERSVGIRLISGTCQ